MTSPSKKILFIVNHRQDRSPGQRYRFEQYLSYLQQHGYECTLSPLIVDAEEDYTFYNSKSVLQKGLLLVKGILRRIRDVFRAGNYDVIFIFREALMTGSIFFEKRFKQSGAKIIFDFDDAIWLPAVSETNKAFQWLKRPDKVDDITCFADTVIVGNKYLQQHALQFNANVVVFPSTVNLDYYKIPARTKAAEDRIIIGWSGSHTTIEHFELILPVLRQLRTKYGKKIHFVVYGDPTYKNTELDIEAIAWSPETEVAVISSFDIGIMPLEDNEWTRGKCSMKGLQYMGLGVASILAAVGMNKEVIQDGQNGFLASDNTEWFDKICLLIESEELRTSIGNAGRKTVEEKYSSQALSAKFLQIIATGSVAASQ